MDKLLVICGPTATGKTDLGVRLAKKFDGEIVSADSRQVYKGLDIVTGKDIPENSKFKIAQRAPDSKLNITNNELEVGYRLKDDIPVWLVDIVAPSYPFSAGEYGVFAQKVITDIWARNKLPIVIGGTGFYIRSIIDPFDTYMIPPNKILRKILESLSLEALQKKLQEEDGEKWEKMNESDRKNPRRLIRAIEVADWRKKYSQRFSLPKLIDLDDILMVGLKTDFRYILRQRIEKRVKARINKGAIDEVKKLAEKKYSWFLPAFTATGAIELKKFLDKEQTLGEAIKSWQYREIAYAKKQITWFKKDKRIQWFDISDYDWQERIEETVAKWYTDKN